MKINRLRLLGFKSFVEATELVIEPGLTGVLGPNGCGKSNLLEALRWVMGETSYKSMRGSSMEDVIFSGTDKRPPRNAAEVTMFLDNSARKAPAEFNDSDTIEITRRIERDMGSAYRINGKETRARDVKILFEDASTGARSPALVRQGQIGEIVNAKPEQRRRILEDAAGIAGLHSRRHEAELRLKQAESNLERLQDSLKSMNSQVESLKRQARQAKRYKELSGAIRRTEAISMHLNWTDVQAQVANDEGALGEAMRTLGLATQTEAAALRAETERAERLQPLRDEEAVRAAVLQRMKVEQENFEKEAKRAADRQSELSARAEQLARDIAREQGLITEAKDVLARLDKETTSLRQEEELSGEFSLKITADLEQTQTAVRAAEARLSELNAQVAEHRATRKSLEQSRHERAETSARLERQLAGLDAQIKQISASAPDIATVSTAQEEGQELSRQMGEIEVQALAAEQIVLDVTEQAQERREQSAEANLKASALKTEIETLRKLLRPDGSDDYPPIVDGLSVAPGFEIALGAALGDDLDAPADEAAPMHWRLIDGPTSPTNTTDATSAPHSDQPLPGGAVPLSNHVQGSNELSRRLRQIGVVAQDHGAQLQALLQPGQRLVSKAGDLWRWDGYVAAAHAPSAAAQRLSERNRLAQLEQHETLVSREAQTIGAAATEADEAYRSAQENERALRNIWRETQNKLAAARQALTNAQTAARETETKLSNVNDTKARLADNLAEAQSKLQETLTAIAQLPDVADLEVELESAQGDAEDKRGKFAEARAGKVALEREKQAREQRVSAIRADNERWTTRRAGAQTQIETLEERQSETMGELEELALLPAKIEEKRQILMSEMSQAEQERQAAADKLAAAETSHKDIVQAMRTAQGLVTTEREKRARLEVRLESARERRTEHIQRIRELLGCAPDGCLALAEIAPETETQLPSLEDTERKLAKLKADRDRLGGVNLAADDELERIAGEFQTIDDERLDLEQAIAKLRGAIASLNKEGRQRLQDAFEVVNEHFKRLFGTLFNGGAAHLELIEGEDPLDSGLEIIARPPGKKPATLSLLSGGEQTLTALSLIFAVFLTNPSPICVLDEVDAPLDDSNVDRFCAMMERMAEETDTRFLVITHHPMTMARMNRLFGVTMGEKGVSQLVSVDLATAEQIVDAA